MKRPSAVSFGSGEIAVGFISLIGMYVISRYSFTLFHMIGELYSIVIGFSLFMLTWNSRRIIDNNYLIFLGIAFFFIAGIDLIHTLAYKGMDLFAGYGTNLPTQLWIAARARPLSATGRRRVHEGHGRRAHGGHAGKHAVQRQCRRGQRHRRRNRFGIGLLDIILLAGGCYLIYRSIKIICS
jgi:hypothetical protein